MTYCADEVTAVDISQSSINVGIKLAETKNIKNIEFVQGDLLNLPFENNSFDLVLSWGVIHHTPDPLKALDELVRVLETNGTIVIAVYLKTNLTFLHEFARKTCLKMPKFLKPAFINSVAFIVRVAELMGKRTNVRPDNIRIASQVEDWFFVPEKYFYTIKEMEEEFKKRNLSSELLIAQTGRFKSSSCFILRGTKL